MDVLNRYISNGTAVIDDAYPYPLMLSTCPVCPCIPVGTCDELYKYLLVVKEQYGAEELSNGAIYYRKAGNQGTTLDIYIHAILLEYADMWWCIYITRDCKFKFVSFTEEPIVRNPYLSIADGVRLNTIYKDLGNVSKYSGIPTWAIRADTLKVQLYGESLILPQITSRIDYIRAVVCYHYENEWHYMSSGAEALVESRNANRYDFPISHYLNVKDWCCKIYGFVEMRRGGNYLYKFSLYGNTHTGTLERPTFSLSPCGTPEGFRSMGRIDYNDYECIYNGTEKVHMVRYIYDYITGFWTYRMRDFDSVEVLGEAAYFCPDVASGYLQGIPGSIFLTQVYSNRHWEYLFHTYEEAFAFSQQIVPITERTSYHGFSTYANSGSYMFKQELQTGLQTHPGEVRPGGSGWYASTGYQSEIVFIDRVIPTNRGFLHQDGTYTSTYTIPILKNTLPDFCPYDGGAWVGEGTVLTIPGWFADEQDGFSEEGLSDLAFDHVTRLQSTYTGYAFGSGLAVTKITSSSGKGTVPFIAAYLYTCGTTTPLLVVSDDGQTRTYNYGPYTVIDANNSLDMQDVIDALDGDTSVVYHNIEYPIDYTLQPLWHWGESIHPNAVIVNDIETELSISRAKAWSGGEAAAKYYVECGTDRAFYEPKAEAVPLSCNACLNMAYIFSQLSGFINIQYGSHSLYSGTFDGVYQTRIVNKDGYGTLGIFGAGGSIDYRTIVCLFNRDNGKFLSILTYDSFLDKWEQEIRYVPADTVLSGYATLFDRTDNNTSIRGNQYIISAEYVPAYTYFDTEKEAEALSKKHNNTVMAISTRAGDGFCPDYAHTPTVACSNLVVNGGEYNYDEVTKRWKARSGYYTGLLYCEKTIPTNKGFLFPDGSFKQHFTSPLFSLFNSCNVNIIFYRQEDVWVCGVGHTIPARDNASPCPEVDPEEFE